MKLRTKFFLVFSILATAALVTLTLFSYQRYTQTVYERMDDISSRLFETAQNTADNVLEDIRRAATSFDIYFNDGTSIIQNLSNYSDPENKPDAYDFLQDTRSFQRTCQSLLFQEDYIYGVYVITPCGYILSYYTGSNGDINYSYDFARDSWYQDTIELDGDFYISSVDEHPVFSGGNTSIFFAQYLKDVYSHEALGVLLIDCNPGIFDLSGINTLPDITLLTIDNTETNEVLYTNYDDIGHAFSEKSRNVLQADLSWAPLRLTMVVDYDSLYQEFSMTGLLLLVVSGVCLLAFFLGAYLISHYMVRPIEHLSRKMASQTGHTLISSTQYLNRTDEIGTLYNEYNAMVENLNLAVKQDYQDRLIILDAQMKSLEARINSHFLFNTLESINSMAELDDNDEIATMSLALGNMFRYTLKTQSELVTVEQELSHVRDYISIQLIRFNGKFRLETDITPEFKKLKVLKLILQPLVENALYHGLVYCSRGDRISISGTTEDSVICIDVRDNGAGIDADTLAALKRSLNEEPSFTELGHRNKQSIGLKNIHSRIELYYGRGYGLTVTSVYGEWTNVRIRLPLIRQEETKCTPM